jgi:ubiquinol-cytochrome c reductase cytochrome c subunit
MQPRKHETTKKQKISVSCFRGFVVAFVFVSMAGAAPQEADRGKQTFVRVGCYQCHGREAQGASTGPRLGPDPMPPPQFTRAIRTPRADMPPYSTKILSEAELADIYAYVSSRARPRK